jgi:ABC-2 type transport system permease protein
MTKMSVPASPAGARAGVSLGRVPMRRLDLSALAALFWLTLRQHARGRRLWVLAALFTLPSLLVILVRSTAPDTPLSHLEFWLLLNMVPYTLLPLTAVLYASGMIQDEIEEQTLTYLLIRPLPRWSIYLVKLVGTLLIAIMLAGVFALVTYAVLYWGTSNWGEVMTARAPQTALLYALSVVGYCSIFGCISLFTRHSLVAGVAYVVILEGILANIDFAVRRMTFTYYFRVLARRWLPLDWEGVIRREGDAWSLNLVDAPGMGECVRTVLAVSLVATVLAAITFASREFRLKTPEGS